jgi:hypothetical protein
VSWNAQGEYPMNLIEAGKTAHFINRYDQAIGKVRGLGVSDPYARPPIEVKPLPPA